VSKATIETEAGIFDLWKEFNPSNAYKAGFDEFAGKIFIPSAENINRLLQKVDTFRGQTSEPLQIAFLNYLETAINFEEPYMAPDHGLWAFYAHLVKEGIHVEHLRKLADAVTDMLRISATRLATMKSWSTEIKILTCNKCAGLQGIIETIKGEAPQLAPALTKVLNELAKYRKKFEVHGIKEGDFSEVYPILQKSGGDIGRVEIYPRILKYMYAYPETHNEIESKGLRWLNAELPKLHELTDKLATEYHVEPTVEAISKRMSELRAVPKSGAVEFILRLREKLIHVINNRLVAINPKYDTRVTVTPQYLVNFIPTAAMSTFNTFGSKPFNIFFVTTDEKRAPASSAPDLFQTLVHEEYGHCVNYSNVATCFRAEPSLLERVHTPFSLAVSDGISFYRELEAIRLLRDLVELPEAKLTAADRELLGELKGWGNFDRLLTELEFIVYKWRIIRFLRAIGDVRINMHKQSLVEFVEWASQKTGLSKATVYNQIVIFQAEVGYAPCYSMTGERIRELQQDAVARGIDVLTFNTYASSVGFPPRSIFESKLKAICRT
jgi:hypothetical protein